MTVSAGTPAAGLPATSDIPSLTARARQLFPPAAARHTDLAITHASGARVWTDDGRELLDFGSGVAVTNVGHGHPDVLRAVRSQLDTLVHAGHNIAVYPGYVELAERLVSLMPGSVSGTSDFMVFYANSGAESIEAAVKLAMHASGRSGLIAFKRSFHGRTLTTTALTASSSAYRRRYTAALPHVHHVDYPAPFSRRATADDEVDRCLAELDELFELVLAPDETAAIVVEPFQGEGGYQPAPEAFLRGLRSRADAHGIALIFDEIQSGFGRTGRMFDFERSDVVPDALVLAKGIANGFPLSAMVAKRELMEQWPPGAHGGTFGGNPVACAAALAVIDVLKGGALANAREVGELLRERIVNTVEKLPIAGEVRGSGVMLGVELRHPDWSPASDVVTEVRRRCLDDGLLVLACGTHKNVLRLMPPTTLTSHEAGLALDILESALLVATDA